jgi:hypothetical protein
MRITTIIVLTSMAAMVALVNPVCAGTKVDSRVPSQVLAIDGDTSDWQGLATIYLEDSVRVVGIAHDATNLYLSWSFSDERLARTVLSRGVTMWLDGEDKKKRTFGVRYTVSEALAKEISLDPRDKNPDQELARHQDFRGPGPGFEMRRLQDPGTITVINGETQEVFAESSDSTGLKAASALQDGVYCFELAVPLQMIGGKVSEQPEDKDRQLRVGVEIGGLSDAEREAMKEQMEEMRGKRMGMGMGMGGRGGMGGGMGGGRGGGMGGGMGGGRGGGMGPGGMGGRSGMRESKPEWLKVTLIGTPAVVQ